MTAVLACKECNRLLKSVTLHRSLLAFLLAALSFMTSVLEEAVRPGGSVLKEAFFSTRDFLVSSIFRKYLQQMHAAPSFLC